MILPIFLPTPEEPKPFEPRSVIVKSETSST